MTDQRLAWIALAVSITAISISGLTIIFGYDVVNNPDEWLTEYIESENQKHQSTLASEWLYRVEQCIDFIATYNGIDVLGHHEKTTQHEQTNNWLNICNLHVGIAMISEYPYLSDRHARIALISTGELLR